MRKLLVAGLILVTLLASMGVVSANLIVNGGFETPEIGSHWVILTAVPAWTLENRELEYQLQNTVGLTPYEGRQYAELDPDFNVKISQTIPVEKGKIYQLSFAQSCRYNDPHLPSLLGVYLDGVLLGQTSCTVASQNAQAWTTHSYTFKPEVDGPVTITFADEGRSDSYGVLLDDVNLDTQSTPVPEFPTFLLPLTFIAGLLAVTFLIRKHESEH